MVIASNDGLPDKMTLAGCLEIKKYEVKEMKQKGAIMLLAVVACIIIIAGVTAYAENLKQESDIEIQGDMPPTLTTGVPTYQYVAKFACGLVQATTAESIISPGDYRTIINIHNPQMQNVTIKKKVVIASPEEPRQPIPPIGPRTYLNLQPDYAFRIDCPDIYKLTGMGAGTFIEGFVVLYPSASLAPFQPRQVDVTALYTASPGAGAGISTMAVETIKPKISVPATTTSYVDSPP